MIRRFLIILSIIAILVLLWWNWSVNQSTDLAVPPNEPASGLTAKLIHPTKPKLEFVEMPEVPTDITKTESQTAIESNPPLAQTYHGVIVPDATLAVPLAVAEHRTIVLSIPLDVSILGVFNVLDGPRRGDVLVDIRVWSGEGPDGAAGGRATYPLSRFSPEDQAYIESWVKQQNAAWSASGSTQPPLTSKTPALKRWEVEEGAGTQVGGPPQTQSSPPQ